MSETLSFKQKFFLFLGGCFVIIFSLILNFSFYEETFSQAMVLTKVASSSSWLARNGAAIVYYKGKLWLMGGYNGSFLNDVWTSTDSINWTLVTASAPW